MQKTTLTLIAAVFALASVVKGNIYDISLYTDATDTLKLHHAVNDAEANNGSVYIPGGTSLTITGPIGNTNNSQGLTIYGDGDTSVITLNTTGNLFDFSFASKTQHLSIRNIKLVTSSNSASGAAIKCMGSNPDGFNSSDPGLLADNVTITATGSGGWTYGIQMSYCSNSEVSNCNISNLPSSYTGAAIYISGDQINCQFVANTISHWDTGILCTASIVCEGIVVDGGTIGPVHNGFVHTGSGSLGWLSLLNATIDCRVWGGIGVYVDTSTDLTWSLFRNNTFYIAQGETGASNEYHMFAKPEYVIVAGNSFDGNSQTGGVVFYPQSTTIFPPLVTRNTFTNIVGASLWLQSGVADATVAYNSFNGGWFYDQGTNTVSSGNY